MNTAQVEINWLAVLAGSVVYCVVSGTWHAQNFFGKKWERAMGFYRPAGWKETKIYYIVPVISCFITSTVLAVLLKLTEVSTLTEAAGIGFISGVGFAAPVTVTNAIMPIIKEPLKVGIITGAAHVFGILLATIVIHLFSV